MTSNLTLSSLPLFPLGTVLFPQGILPLQIFEVRYLDMISRCHRAGAPFGVVSLSSGNEVIQAGQPQEPSHARDRSRRRADPAGSSRAGP